MAIKIGIDMESIDRVSDILEKKEKFASRVLTSREMEKFQTLKGRRQVEFLTGRYAAKEAFSKAVGTGIGKLSFQDIEILPNTKGAPKLSQSVLPKWNVEVSISHTKEFAVAVVIIEKKRGIQWLKAFIGTQK